MTYGGYSAAGTGFTKRVITNFGDIAEDATVLAGGSYSAAAPLSSSVPWVMQMVASVAASRVHPIHRLRRLRRRTRRQSRPPPGPLAAELR